MFGPRALVVHIVERFLEVLWFLRDRQISDDLLVHLCRRALIRLQRQMFEDRPGSQRVLWANSSPQWNSTFYLSTIYVMLTYYVASGRP